MKSIIQSPKIKKIVFYSFVGLFLLLFFGYAYYTFNSREYKNKIIQQSQEFFEKGEQEKAMKTLKKLGMSSVDSKILNSLSETYFKNQKFDEFLSIGDQIQKKNHTYYTMAAYVYRSRQDSEKAIENYKKAIEALPKYQTNYTNLATYYMVLGQDKNALKTVKQGLNIRPKSTALNLLCASIYLKLKDYEQAKNYANAVLKYDKDNKKAQKLISQI